MNYAEQRARSLEHGWQVVQQLGERRTKFPIEGEPELHKQWHEEDLNEAICHITFGSHRPRA